MILAASDATWPDVADEFHETLDDLFAKSQASRCHRRPSKEDRPTVSGILRCYWPDYLKNKRPFLSPYEIHVMTQLITCRTEELGGSVWRCTDCGHEHVFYHSCGLRQCPTCGAARRDEWLQRALNESLPVPYVHIVTTTPHEFSLLALANKQLVYNLLLQATRKAFQKLAKQLGFQVSGLTLLHTWGQWCLLHMHTHSLLPAGGLSLDGTRWISADDPHNLFRRETLMKTFRQMFCDGLEKLYISDKLMCVGMPPTAAASLGGFRKWLEPIRQKRWIVHQQGPPREHHTSEAAVRYLANYMQGTAISDRRLVSDDGQIVTFTAKDYRNGGQRVPVEVTGEEFVERFLMHILPKGFHRVRYFGFMASRAKQETLQHCRQLLGAETTHQDNGDSSPKGSDGDSDQAEPEFVGTCQKCRKRGTLQWQYEIPGTRGWQRYRSLVPNATKKRLGAYTEKEVFTSGTPP